MLRLFFALIILLHGIIHIMGFAKAFGYGNITQLKDIPKPAGLFWLVTAILFIATLILFLLNNEVWWIAGLAAAVTSQVLIASVWQDAKFGTYANVLIVIVCLLSMGNWKFEKGYKKDVAENLVRTASLPQELLTEKDVQHLPLPVQRYLNYTGVLNKPKVYNYKIVFHGQMRDKKKDWFSFTSEQHNMADIPTRLFFMKAAMFGLRVPGYHAYKNGHGTMDIRLFGLFQVAGASGSKINKAETVTIFNDMCLMAPATLIDKRIQWETIADNTVKAVFTVNSISVTSLLYFNEKGELTNFVSDDRYDVNAMKQYRFSTPVKDYINIKGFRLPSYGEAVWHYPDGAFTYGKFNLKDVQYNIK
jgi:hypothetical protein